MIYILPFLWYNSSNKQNLYQNDYRRLLWNLNLYCVLTAKI